MTEKTLLIILILAATIFSASRVIFSGSRNGVQVFDKYDFENGHYVIVGTTWANRGNKIQKELGDFYTDDIKILSELKWKWITGEPSPFFACGYHYIIHVLKDGAEVESFALNLEKGCNTIVMDHGQYYFDPDKLGSFIGRLKKPVIERMKFKTPEEGRAYIKSLSGRTDLLMIETPDWLEYDGEFRFYADCDFGNFDHDLIRKCLDRIDTQIRKEYSGAMFTLDYAGTIGNKLMIEMKCFEGLYNKFDLYEVGWKWDRYSPVLTVLWKREKVGASTP